MIFRDDDIQKGTNIERFIMVDNLFIKHKVIHTIAVITEDLGYNHNLVDYINKHSHIDVQLHCHTHIDFSIANENELRKQFENGLYILKECFKVKPTVITSCTFTGFRINYSISTDFSCPFVLEINGDIYY